MAPRLVFAPIKVWPDGWHAEKNRPYSPFTANYSDTLLVLDRELDALKATGCTAQVDTAAGNIVRGGDMRGDARVSHPGVIVSIETPAHGALVYSTDKFCGFGKQAGWHANLRAVALGLEALRKVERYGIAERGQQYAGYRELGSGIPMGPGLGQMTVEEAARIMRSAVDSDQPVEEIVGQVAVIKDLYRRASKAHHPDQGGNEDLFKLIGSARDLLLTDAR